MSNRSVPRLSVVIALDDRPTPVDRIIAALAAEVEDSYPIEVLVHAGEGTVGAAAFARIDRRAAAAVNLRLFCTRKRGRAQGLNLGIQQAAADNVWILADDFIPRHACLAAHRRFHETHPEEQSVGVGPTFFPEHIRRGAFPRWLEDSGALSGVSFTHPEPGALREFFYGANTSFKRSFLFRVGLFDEHFLFHTTDDFEFGLRARQMGMQVVYLPEARVIHEHELHWSERKRAMWRFGYSNVWLEEKYPQLPAPSAQLRRSSWRYEVRSWRWWLRWLVTRDPQHRIRSWQYGLLSASVAGYQAGLAAGQASDPEVRWLTLPTLAGTCH